jgi:hypothetical protein
VSSIRNSSGIWINSDVFREEAISFLKNGYYCSDPLGSPSYDAYWEEQWNRCVKGYTVAGATITGKHYFYLNFCPIKRTLIDENEKQVSKNRVARKTISFPDFWDGDYEYYHILDIAGKGCTEEFYKSLLLDTKLTYFDGGKHILVGKARRKGFSYKNGSVAAHQYTFERNSLALICAYNKKYLYPKGTMTMAESYCNFINEHTAFAKRRLINKQDHIKAGYVEKYNGVEVEKGFKSEILALTFKDNPDAARGKDGGLVLLEEVGDWLDFKSAYAAILPCVQDGDLVTGQLIGFGTGGDSLGSTADFLEMYNNPEPYNFLPFINIWDDNAIEKTCGYFFPVNQNMIGFIDKQGNSDKEGAKARELKERARISSTAKDKNTLTKYITEFPFNGREAFSISSGNVYPTLDLIKQLGFLESSKDGDVKGSYGKLEFEGTRVKFIIDESLRPADFPVKESDKAEGCVVIWEHPVDNNQWGLYIAGNDPYDQDKAANSMSLGSTFIMKRAMPGYDNHDKIVAEYTGRPSSAKEYYEQARRLLIYYNALCLYENEKKGIFFHFEQQRSLNLLAFTPTMLKGNANSNVSRVYGQHMTKGIKEELEILARDWLNEQVGEGRTNLQNILSKPLLKELIAYNPISGNYDRHIAFLMVIVQAMQMHRTIVDANKKKTVDPFWTRKHNF